jgi:hypothetical protein
VRDVRRIDVHFQDQGSPFRARPYGINGAVISFDVLDEQPADPEHFSRTTLATRTPYILKFAEEERGSLAGATNTAFLGQHGGGRQA